MYDLKKDLIGKHTKKLEEAKELQSRYNVLIECHYLLKGDDSTDHYTYAISPILSELKLLYTEIALLITLINKL